MDIIARFANWYLKRRHLHWARQLGPRQIAITPDGQYKGTFVTVSAAHYAKALAEMLNEVLDDNEYVEFSGRLSPREADELRAQNAQLTRLLESLTPGGSEFHGAPVRCAAWISERLASRAQEVRRRQVAETEEAQLRATIAQAQRRLAAQLARPGGADDVELVRVEQLLAAALEAEL